MSALRLINETTTTAGVQSVNITDVFSSDYDLYKLVGSKNLANNSTATGFNLRFINAGNSVVATDYDYAQLAMKGDAAQSAGNVAYVFKPFSSSHYTYCIWQSSTNPGGNYRMYKGIGVLHQLSCITGFQAELNESAGEFASGGKIRVYGLRVDT